ncbi:NAD-binding protein [Dendrothele bispora CBS 962.96]|uniref:NAD-binding protein n=1 Tax=Dendrothele bispora (strain CBS 962.96) TaxID=1314807 RepID=A0A4V4HIB1_DENBC|nr:NAD-binding protein [Dendrothele bispora CBS 962.96]
MSSFEVQNLFNVKGKVVLVTGGSRGIGKMISTGFIRNGAKVYISSRSAQDCKATAEELTTLGPGVCIPLPADLQDYEEVERLAKELASREKELHVLVNNAGAAWGASVDDFPDAAFTKILTLNLQRVFTVTQKVLPLLRAAAAKTKQGEVYTDPARIINIGSVEGLGVPPHETYPYSVSKAALHHLSRHLAAKLAEDGIISNTIACGLFPSKMTAYTIKMAGDAIVAGIPLQRAGKPEDIAGTALYLASPAASWVTGATITLDGGFLVSSKM